MTCPGSPSFWRGGVGSEVCSFLYLSHTVVGTVNNGRQTDTGPAPLGPPKSGWAAGVWVSPTHWPLREAILSFSASWSSTRQNGLGGNRDHSSSGQCLRNTYPMPGAVHSPARDAAKPISCRKQQRLRQVDRPDISYTASPLPRAAFLVVSEEGEVWGLGSPSLTLVGKAQVKVNGRGQQ